MAVLALSALLSSCGGGGDSPSGNVAAAASGGVASNTATNIAITPAGPNVVPVSVDQGLVATANIPTVSVTICVPGTAQCQTIDHIQVDTGSSGLRLIASTVSLPLPAVTVGGNPLGECALFADGFTWGAVKSADIKLSSEAAGNIPIELISDPSVTSVPPTACSRRGTAITTAQELRVNGLLGVGLFAQDCGSACATSANLAVYFTCAGANCTGTALPLTQQVTNPVARFATDNNGVLLQLPLIPQGGAGITAGALVFGIGTQPNNQLGNVSIFETSAIGYISTSFNGAAYPNSFLDSGSNGYFFDYIGEQQCSGGASAAGFYCPPTPQTLSATNTGINSVSQPLTFLITNADALSAGMPAKTAFNDLAGTGIASTSFDWGLPFFYGRNVFTAIQGAATPVGNGPYFAY
jgi:hypothetical protein